MIIQAEQIHVSGIVQGVGFRPTVWHLAQRFNLTGSVSNDGDGVVINVQGLKDTIDSFVQTLIDEKPILSRIDNIKRSQQNTVVNSFISFDIVDSINSDIHTGITADAATCDACLDEILDPNNRRYHYPFTNCTHCGPRLSIISGIPYDRSHTSMAEFTLCNDCKQEYNSPDDRRFHAQPNACNSCGPQLYLTDKGGKKLSTKDVIVTAVDYLNSQEIVAIKGIGGFHLAVNACDDVAVKKLRQRKSRARKPFALMAKDIAMIERYCYVDDDERVLLTSSASPIVLLKKRDDGDLAASVAPGQNQLGFMLPYSPLHYLLMDVLAQPLVLTSGNAAHEPQCISNEDALSKLADIADYFLLHNRDIVNRVDDSVLRIMAGEPQFLRRARGYAPESLILADGFNQATPVLAMGGELKNTFCLLKDGHAIISQHMGDLENYQTYQEYQHNIDLYQSLFQYKPEHIAIDAHPEYMSTKVGYELASQQNQVIHTIQHHHAHLASCLADNVYPLNAPPVIGVVLDGLGFGDDGALWGGEFLLADYNHSLRLAHFKPVALLGGNLAMKEPWRNSFAHLVSCLGWEMLEQRYSELDLIGQFYQKPVVTMNAMLTTQFNCPLVSSAGRLFDAVAATIGICFEQIEYEGQAAIELEACIDDEAWLDSETTAYSFSIEDDVLDPSPMWISLLDDLLHSIDISLISARFHRGLSRAVQQLATKLARQHHIKTIALSGGVFQNKTLFEDVKHNLQQQGFTVLSHRNVPANDGGLALGQAVITASRIMRDLQCV
tara:strand:- start:13516 stop:15852 length:2337 start_codon:yes stop_codon:yes gene_type:complete